MGVLECVNAGLKSTGKFIKANSPTILSWIAIGGVWTTATLAAYETPGFLRDLEAEGLDDPEIRRERWLDTLKVFGRNFYPSIFSGIATSVSIGKSDKDHLKREMAAVAMAKASSLDLKELKDKIIEEQGEKGLKEIQDKIAQDHVNADPPPEDKTKIYKTGFGLSLCREPWSGQYIYTNYKAVYDAANDMRKKMYEGEFVPVIEWLSLLPIRFSELTPTQRDDAENSGWMRKNLNDTFDISFGECRGPDGEPCNEIIFWRDPDVTIGYPYR